MEATARGLFVGGDGSRQGGVTTGRVAFYDFNSVPAASTTDTTITTPIEGRVVPAGSPFSIQGTGKAPSGVQRVQVEVQDRSSKQYLQDNLTSWGSSNSINATLGTPANGVTPWSLNLSVTGTRTLQLKAKTFAVNGTSDSTKALKTMETFSFDDQTPATSITGPGSPQPSTTFTVVGTATDDHGVNALTYWFRDENGEYLQDDGSVAPIYNTFRGLPDVVGATNATWSYEVTLPHEGQWRGSATAIDSAGQADLRSAVRDWIVSSSIVPPVVAIQQPASMVPPAATPTVTVAPGAPMTFSGTASDSDGLRNVEISLRNSSTRENLGADGQWGVNVAAGLFRVSPGDIAGNAYGWTYTTPFNLSPGTYSFTVRATDDIGLTTTTANRGSLTVNAQVPGDAFPDGVLANPGLGQVSLPSAQLDLAGTATDDKGVAGVKVAVYDQDSGRYVQADGSLASGFATRSAVLSNPTAASTGWSLSLTLPQAGDYVVTAWAVDTSGQQDPVTTGATGRYLYFPGDLLPDFVATLGQPVTGQGFTEGRIVVSGRAEDDISMARVEVGIVDSAGRYLGSTGTFTSTTPSWRTAFLNSPGSPGSNFSYTTPVVPDGTYTVMVRATDHHDQIGPVRSATGVTVTHPVNAAPMASATVSCNQNVCTFDGRGSTDENPSGLSYSWVFGTTQGTATGAVPVKTFTAPGSFPVTLTVRDEWNATATTTLSVTVVEPGSNAAPVPTATVTCSELTCAVSSAGSFDPQPSDVLTYSWSWGDGTANSAGAGATHTYAAPGTYTVTLTATDGWGKSAATSRTVTLTEPVGNQPPTVAFSWSCTGPVCAMSSNGTVDPEGNQLRYLWTWNAGASTSTSAFPTITFPGPGTYPVTLRVTDGWNRFSELTQNITVG
jgi:PKD repeat protein